MQWDIPVFETNENRGLAEMKSKSTISKGDHVCVLKKSC